MGFLDKAKAAADSAATKAKETAGDLQTKRELGHKAYEQAEAGELSSSALDPLIQRIKELKAQLEAETTAA